MWPPDAVRVASAKAIRGAVAAAICTSVVLAGLSSPSDAGAAPSVSSNWAGYVTVGKARASSFSAVSGSWTQPQATCTAGRQTYSAVWVGLGGYRGGSQSLEQIGGESDCTRSGRPSYLTWLEVVPAAPTKLTLAVHPGDRLAASVSVRARDVTLRIRDLTTGAKRSTTRHSTSLDTSSADWIVEAPSVCAGAGDCTALPLTNFGRVSFSAATATAGGHTGAAAAARWPSQALELRQSALRATTNPSGVSTVAPVLVAATPSSISTGHGAFSVRFREERLRGELPVVPHLPGGGPP